MMVIIFTLERNELRVGRDFKTKLVWEEGDCVPLPLQ